MLWQEKTRSVVLLMPQLILEGKAWFEENPHGNLLPNLPTSRHTQLTRVVLFFPINGALL